LIYYPQDILCLQMLRFSLTYAYPSKTKFLIELIRSTALCLVPFIDKLEGV